MSTGSASPDSFSFSLLVSVGVFFFVRCPSGNAAVVMEHARKTAIACLLVAEHLRHFALVPGLISARKKPDQLYTAEELFGVRSSGATEPPGSVFLADV